MDTELWGKKGKGRKGESDFGFWIEKEKPNRKGSQTRGANGAKKEEDLDHECHELNELHE
jgi:hypothetical protein